MNEITPVQIGACGPVASFHRPPPTIATTPAASEPLNASAYSSSPCSVFATTGMAVATARYS